MFLRKIDGPRVVVLPDGRRMSRADLPNERMLRWSASRKRAVAEAVQAGLLSREAAKQKYELSDYELDQWCRNFPLQRAKDSAFRKAPVGCG